MVEDIFRNFDKSYEEHKALTPGVPAVLQYRWHFLNTCVTNTNEKDGRIFIVDGQQRLTTLTLMLTALYHMCIEKINAASKPKDSPGEPTWPFLCDWVKERVIGTGSAGRKFWMAHEKREPLMQALFEGDTPVYA